MDFPQMSLKSQLLYNVTPLKRSWDVTEVCSHLDCPYLGSKYNKSLNSMNHLGRLALHAL